MQPKPRHQISVMDSWEIKASSTTKNQSLAIPQTQYKTLSLAQKSAYHILSIELKL